MLVFLVAICVFGPSGLCLFLLSFRTVLFIYCFFFFFNDTSTTQIYTLSLHDALPICDDSAYVHYCPNETIDGIEIFEEPSFGDKTVVADFSSCILSQPIDVSKYGIIYAGAQKNIGPSGITIVIVREDLIGYAQNILPSVLNYKILQDHDSMFNTPPTFAWYMSGLVFKWIKRDRKSVV